MKKVLVCGDSFSTTDSRFPNLHWSECLGSDIHVMNLAYGGASNTMIEMQIMQGLILRPDFVLISFTTPFRAEFDKNNHADLIDNLDPMMIYNYNYSRWSTSCYEDFKEAKKIYEGYLRVASYDCEVIRCVFAIIGVLDHLSIQEINFAFSLGGMDPDIFDPILEKNYIPLKLDRYRKNQIATNLWNHQDLYRDRAPWFHVSDAKIQNQYAQECRQHIFGI